MQRSVTLAVLAFVALAAPRPAAALDVAPWDAVLQAHGHRGGVDYGALKADEEAMANLDRFLASVATMSESEGLASWLNAYNATVVKAVVDRYPMRSVMDTPGFFDRVPHRIAGRMRTLDAVENQLIRPRFQDARVHFALNCAAFSCPALSSRAFRAGSLDRTLDRLAARAVRSNMHVRVSEGRVQVSKIFEWFAEDFTRGGQTVLGWIRSHDDGGRLADVPADAELSYRRYDWRLNDRPRA
ncbi:MAG: DUF547 domain-containing protein [Myxococcota bacterium]